MYTVGANVDHGELDGWTALHFAAFNNFSEIVDMLLGAGARTNLQNIADKTAKDLATDGKHEEIVAKITAAEIAAEKAAEK